MSYRNTAIGLATWLGAAARDHQSLSEDSYSDGMLCLTGDGMTWVRHTFLSWDQSSRSQWTGPAGLEGSTKFASGLEPRLRAIRRRRSRNGYGKGKKGKKGQKGGKGFVAQRKSRVSVRPWVSPLSRLRFHGALTVVTESRRANRSQMNP